VQTHPRVHGRAGHKRLDSGGGAREREEKEVVVLAITRVELIDSRKVFETVLPLRRLFINPGKPLYDPVKKAK